VERQASRPSSRTGTARRSTGHLSPSLDLSHALIPVVRHVHRALGIDRDRGVVNKKRNFEALYFLSRPYLEILSV
jgi:hypothetical protein